MELYTLKKCFKVEEEGDPDFFIEGAREDEEQPQQQPLPSVIYDEVMGMNH